MRLVAGYIAGAAQRNKTRICRRWRRRKRKRAEWLQVKVSEISCGNYCVASSTYVQLWERFVLLKRVEGE